MGSGRETLAGQVARLMLLACTLFGVVAMHSFGRLHGAHVPLAIAAHPHAPAPPAQVAGHDPMGSTDVASLAGFAAGSCPAQGCLPASAVERVADGGGQHEGWNVCLAVLGSTGAAPLVMRRAALAAVTALAAGILTGCGSTTETATGQYPDMASSHTVAISTPSGSRTPAAFNDADAMFAQMMIPHHRQAVDMAELAATRAGDAHVKKLAATIRAAQEPEITTMTGWLRTWGAPTTTHTAGHDGMEHGDMPGLLSSQGMAALEAASGKDFDRRFLTGMIAHHEGAISMARQEIRDGADPAAKALAQQIATSQQCEVEEMKEILARL